MDRITQGQDMGHLCPDRASAHRGLPANLHPYHVPACRIRQFNCLINLSSVDEASQALVIHECILHVKKKILCITEKAKIYYPVWEFNWLENPFHFSS